MRQGLEYQQLFGVRDPQGAKEDYGSEAECVADNNAYWQEYAATYSKECADAYLDAYACYATAECSDAEACDKLIARAEKVCAPERMNEE